MIKKIVYLLAYSFVLLAVVVALLLSFLLKKIDTDNYDLQQTRTIKVISPIVSEIVAFPT